MPSSGFVREVTRRNVDQIDEVVLPAPLDPRVAILLRAGLSQANV